MKHFGLLAGALLFAASGAHAQNAASDAAGVWKTASGGYVQFYEDGGEWKGTIVGSESGKARQDTENPDPAKRDRRLLGTTVVQGMEYVGDGEFKDGEIYDPNNGKTYSAKATLTGPDTLDVRGYVGISLIGRSQTWTRIPEDAPNVHQDLLQGGGTE